MIENLLKLSINKYLDLLNNKNSSLNGVLEEASPFISLSLALLSEKDSIIITSSDREAENIYNLAKSFHKDFLIHYFPSLISSPYQKISPPKSTLVKRINTLSQSILTPEAKIVITSAKGFLEKIVPKEYLQNRFFNIKVGDTLDIEKLLTFLINNNYQKASMVVEDGQFTIRGDIIDVYSTNIGAFRIDLFDNNVEKIRIFDVYTQKTIAETTEITIEPSCEIIIDKTFVNNFKYNYQTYFNKVNKELFESLDNGILPKGIESYAPLFYEESANISDFLKNPQIIILNKVHDTFKEINENYNSEYQYLTNSQNIFKENTDILPPSQMISTEEDVNILLNKYNVINVNSFKNLDNPNNYNLDISPISTMFMPYKSTNTNYFQALIKFIHDHKNHSFVILTASEQFYNNLISTLQTNSIEFALSYDITKKINVLKDININGGFIFNNIIFISEFDISGIKKTFSAKKPNNKKILEHISNINKGDIVVHNKHGFGEYQGITTLKVNNSDHDFLELLYQKGEKLYIPVENIDSISRYGSNQENVGLDKLGSSSFEKKHNKVKEKVKDIAYELIKTAAQRHTKKAPIATYDVESYEAFCKDFPYLETEDQINAISDIIKDLTSGTPTDRLVCGDVGFGKTEVAMRAAYIMASCGYSVAIITPTTLLCRQHYNNFKNRFKNFPINIAQLSRFVSAKEKKQVKLALESGQVDIVIGTHALFSDTIKFKNLGLIIIDEEQSFGVLHKEKLKNIREDAHIITLSATPIPRTVQLAFKGIKDLSLITTPPVDKLPINTYVLPYDLLTIKNAILQEINRSGQVYFVCPRIADILELQSSLDRLGFTKYVIVHGQMQPPEIENSMLAFQNQEYDILISTNIIESGLDLHNVNTILIEKPELFGLAQLYQLRGRVGRGKNQAYAYLLYNKNKPLSPSAEKRLQILQNLDYLGASFALANYDLDIRGAGNIIGEEQSGHVKEIGFDLYQKLLEQEIYNLKHNVSGTHEDTNFSPSINLGIPVLIPKNYIADIETSIEIYQRLGRIKDILEIEELKDEMMDRFGKIPPQVENLFISINLKLKCKKAMIDKIVYGTKGIMLSFYNGQFKEVEKLVSYISGSGGMIALRPDGKIFLNTINLDIKEQISKSMLVLNDLAAMLK